MTTLGELKSQHPEWCFSCGKWWLEADGVHTCHEHPIIAVLLAKAEEDEAEIASYINTLQSIASALGARIGSDLSELPDHANGITARIAAQEAEIAELKRQVSEAHSECSEDLGRLHEKLDAERLRNEALEWALRGLLETLPEDRECNDFHHARSDYHKFDERCPVLDRFDRSLKAARAALKGGQ